MAMACSLSSALSCLALSATPILSSSLSHQGRLAGTRLQVVAPMKAVCRKTRSFVVRASTEENVGEETTTSDPISSLKLQSEIAKKLAKKAELRRKRLVRKRHLRKKGRWPPSKVKKNKNV